MKRQKQMQKAFGINEFGQADLPVKISNVHISRIVYGAQRGCSRCFPRIRNEQLNDRQQAAKLEAFQNVDVQTAIVISGSQLIKPGGLPMLRFP